MAVFLPRRLVEPSVVSTMAEISVLEPIGDDCEGERGERGERGKRGHRGHRGHDGDPGSTGPTGPTGPTSSPTRQIFTTSGTYVPTPGTTKVQVRMAGGGGGGGGALGGGGGVGGGGAAGAALDFVLDGPITGGPVVIGAGGTGGTSGLPGNFGLPTTVTINGTTYTAAPGGGGEAAFAPSGLVVAQGGITQPGSSAVDIVSGDDGMAGVSVDPGAGGILGGNGGSGEFGIGGRGFVGGSGNGLPGSGFGSGGGGGTAVVTDQSGGDGAPGVVIIDEFI